jgi:hypothetical protein
VFEIRAAKEGKLSLHGLLRFYCIVFITLARVCSLVDATARAMPVRAEEGVGWEGVVGDEVVADRGGEEGAVVKVRVAKWVVGGTTGDKVAVRPGW